MEVDYIRVYEKTPGDDNNNSGNTDKLTKVTAPTSVAKGESVTISIDYSATENLKIVSLLQQTGTWATYSGAAASTNVSAGTGTVNLTFTIPNDVPVGSNFQFQNYITTTDGGWAQNKHNLSKSPITVIAGGGTTKITEVSSPTSIIRGNTVSFNVKYNAVGTQKISCAFQSTKSPNYKVYVSTLKTVSSGSGTINVSLAIPNDVPLGSDYQFQTYISPDGSWSHADRHNLTKAPITVTSGGDNSSDNILINPGFESGSSQSPNNWWRNNNALVIRDSDLHKNGSYSLKIKSNSTGEFYAASNFINVDSGVQKIKFGGWSKCSNVQNSANYSIYLKVTFTDNTVQWPSVAINKGTHDWEKVERTLTYSKTIKSVKVFPWLSKGTGVVWFDDIFVQTITSSGKKLANENEFTPLKGSIATYPNPNTGYFTIKLKSVYKGDISFSVFAIDGRQVNNSRTVKSENEFLKTIDISDQQSGTYFIKIIAGENQYIQKIIKR